MPGNTKHNADDDRAPAPDRHETILMLQGLATPFFSDLAKTLHARGHRLFRVNFSAGDWLFGLPCLGAVTSLNYRGKAAGLGAFYRALMRERAITTVLLFGDCRPIHEPAVTAARAAGIRVLVMEEGYTRPGWITMEQGGTNGFSAMPKDAGAILALAESAGKSGALKDPSAPGVGTDMVRRVGWDLLYQAATFFGFPVFPNFRSHRPQSIFAEIGGWGKRMVRSLRFRRRNAATIDRYSESPTEFFLVPLQLNTDFQIRRHADVGGMPRFIETVVASFAAHAPQGTRLFFKNHPLDNGLVDYRSLIAHHARAQNIADRVDFASGGDLTTLLKAARGVVLVNSTVGFAALKLLTPVKALGRALYAVPGLADSASLDAFWAKPKAPDAGLVAAFLATVTTYCEIRGDLFSKAGIALAVRETVEVVEGRQPRLPAPHGSAAS